MVSNSDARRIEIPREEVKVGLCSGVVCAGALEVRTETLKLALGLDEGIYEPPLSEPRVTQSPGPSQLFRHNLTIC
jgi:hypothetical protein